MKRFLVSVVVIGCIFCSVSSVLAVAVGQSAPDFQGKTLAGKDFKLSAYQGQPIVLKIGTTWCPSCREQAESIDSLHDYLVEKGVRYIDVFLDESESSVNKYYHAGGYHKPTATVLDAGAAHRAYNVYVIPRLVLIDKDFTVVRDGDTLSARDLQKKIEKMLKGAE